MEDTSLCLIDCRFLALNGLYCQRIIITIIPSRNMEEYMAEDIIIVIIIIIINIIN